MIRKLPAFAVLILTSWYAMQAVHELGHVVHAAASGGQVSAVVLHPFEVSRTELSVNPAPLFVAWGGFAWGCLIPLALWGLTPRSKAHLARFFAGFCLVANGIYFVVGGLERGADPGDLMRFGAPAWQVLGAGAIAFAAGLALWNGLGPAFGIGEKANRPPEGSGGRFELRRT